MKALFFAHVIAFFVTTAGIAAEFHDALTSYENQVSPLISQEQNESVRTYLTARLADAQSLDQMEPGDARLPDALRALVDRRLASTGANLDTAIRRSDSSRAEERIYGVTIAKYIDNQYITLLKLQGDLLDRKYFKTETAKNANFLEGIVNGYWKLTRTDQGDPKMILNEPTLGVHPWEAIFRLEPTVAMRGGAQAAIIGAGGLSYSYFPDVRRTGEQVKLEETPLSRYLKKAGFRAGLGAAQLNGKTRFVTGAGIQVNALGIWALYDPKRSHWMLGLGMADLDKLKKFIGYFN